MYECARGCSIIFSYIFLFADINFCTRKYGTPLIQFITLHIAQSNSDTSGIEDIIEHFIHCIAKLTPVMEDCQTGHYMSALDAAFQVSSFESAKVIVKAGRVHPVNGLRIPVLYEYYKFGTNKFLTWLVNELPQEDLDDLVTAILGVMGDSLCEDEDKWALVGRHPAHALLTTGKQQFTKALVQGRNSNDILSAINHAGQTALHIAAEMQSEAIVSDLLNV